MPYRVQQRQAARDFETRYPGLRAHTVHDPIVAVAFAKVAGQGLAPEFVFAACIEAMAERHAEVMKAYLAAVAYAPPPPITAPDGSVYEYIGPCATCGRSGAKR